MVDGVLLLVDAAEGPLPQTRFVLRKALERGLPVVLVVNKIDRPDARIAEVVDEVYDLFLDLDADEDQIDFPIVYTDARDGLGHARPRRCRAPTCSRCSTLLLEHRARARRTTPTHPLQALVTNLDASPYVGRLAICRVQHGTIRQGSAGRLVPGRRHASSSAKVGRALRHREPRPGRGRRGRPPASSSPSPGIDRDHDRRDARRPRRPRPAAGDHRRRADALDDDRRQHLAARRTRRQQAHRPPDQGPARRTSWSATSRSACSTPSGPTPGRSRAAASSSSRSWSRRCAARASSSPSASPQVVTREIDGKLHEPVERLTIDVPEEYVGAVTQLLGDAQGRAWSEMVNHGTGWVRLDYRRAGPRPDRLPHRVPHRDPRHRACSTTSSRAASRGRASCAARTTGSLVADRTGADHRLRDRQPAGARPALRRARRRRSTRA